MVHQVRSVTIAEYKSTPMKPTWSLFCSGRAVARVPYADWLCTCSYTTVEFY